MLLVCVLVYSLFISCVRAVCCSNHKLLCVGQQTCTPNCPDKVSYCAPDRETCANNGLGDGWGACVQIVTVKELRFGATSTTTKYTGTTTKASSTQTKYVYNTRSVTVTVTDLRTATRTIISATTSTIKPKFRLAKREITSTKRVTEYPCSTTRDDRCTATLSTVYTQYTVATETRTSVVQITFRSTFVTTTTVLSTTWVTSFTSLPTSSTRVGGIVSSSSTSIGSSGTSTRTVVVTAYQTFTDDGNGVIAGPTSVPSATLGTADNSSQQDTPMSTVNESGQLSTGAKAAIGTTVGTVVIAIIGLSWFYRRKKKEKKAMYTPVSASPGYAHAEPQMMQPESHYPYANMPVRNPVPQVHQALYIPLLSHTPAPVPYQQYDYPTPLPPYNPYQHPYPEQTVQGHARAMPIHEGYARPTYVAYSSHVPY